MTWDRPAFSHLTTKLNVRISFWVHKDVAEILFSKKKVKEESLKNMQKKVQASIHLIKLCPLQKCIGIFYRKTAAT